MIFVGGVSTGILSGWQTVLDVLLYPLGYTQSQAAWLGFSASTIGIFSGLIMGKIADKYARHFKKMLIILFFSSSICFTW